MRELQWVTGGYKPRKQSSVRLRRSNKGEWGGVQAELSGCRQRQEEVIREHSVVRLVSSWGAASRWGERLLLDNGEKCDQEGGKVGGNDRLKIKRMICPSSLFCLPSKKKKTQFMRVASEMPLREKPPFNVGALQQNHPRLISSESVSPSIQFFLKQLFQGGQFTLDPIKILFPPCMSKQNVHS